MMSANTTNLIQAISIEGNVADRYFAVTSDTPRNTVDTRISPMPRNGWSARAGAVRRIGLFGGSGEEALSSLAAAAGGGVTAKLRASGFESGEAASNDNWPASTRRENRQPICAIAQTEAAAATFC